MSARRSLLILIIGIAVILAAGCIQPAAVQQPSPASPVLNVTVPFAPIPVPSRNGINLAYELELVPADGQVPVPEKVEVIDPAIRKDPVYRG